MKQSHRVKNRIRPIDGELYNRGGVDPLYDLVHGRRFGLLSLLRPRVYRLRNFQNPLTATNCHQLSASLEGLPQQYILRYA